MKKSNSYENNVDRDLYLRKVALGEIDGQLTGYPSLDKPWLKYYSEEHIKAPLPHMTAYEYLKTMNAGHLDSQAIDSFESNYTYRELFSMIDAVAASLWKLGIGKGNIVLEMLPVLSHETLLLYAVDAVGAALAPLSPLYPAEEVCNAINKFSAELFFTFDDVLTHDMEKIIYENTDVRHIINISFSPLEGRDHRTMSWQDFLLLGKDVQLPTISRDTGDLLFLASTGGSTGAPKSVMLNDDCFNIIVHQFICSDVNYNAGDKWIRLWPIFSAACAVSNHHLPLCTGGIEILRVLPENMADFDKILLEDKPNHIIMIPQLLDALEKSELLRDADLSFIKTAGCGGLSLTSQFEERVNKFYRDHNVNTFLGYGWGCSENASSVAMRSSFETTSIGTAGAPMVKTVVSVFDPESGKELHYDEEGELCIHSPTMMMGYFGDPDMTHNVKRTHSDGTVWLHTGDLGTVSKDGIVTMKGRMTRMILISPNLKIYPAALEDAISKVPGVQEVAFCAIPNEKQDGFYSPVCFIVPDGKFTSEDTKRNVEEFCVRAFPEDTRPNEIYIRDHLPLTKVGKPDIKALEAGLQATFKNR